ncbi:N-acetylmuramidase domain-containing protein [Agrilutibacter solisilvae]|uniref:DUF3380 domain-containing protein n=1 Tax=Agrilutibacter solisilvae TaxID=2763317 RepID=A0A974Y1X0_9GAMM|nr:N-acetylmuramidase domain-containing protein [Lysobacter solisilvae]QSX79738.1 DUF3380 domain-containing protein [Lysobacter solisilvae]
MEPTIRTTVEKKVWEDLARALQVEEATLRAVAEVEAAGSGFLPAPDLRPKILFEGHAFHRLTGGRYSDSHPAISHRHWDPKKYSGTLAGEWARLDAASQLDRTAALQAASWGLFQIMGFNYPYCGSADVEAFVAAQHESGTQQLALFVKFVSRPPFLDALKTKNWAAFAEAYNGPGYAANHYDTRLADAHKRWTDELAGVVPAGPPPADTAPGDPPEPETKATVTKAPVRAARAGLSVPPAPDTLPPGREDFAPVPAMRRENDRVRNVRPDPVDLRDWEYRPAIAVAPPATRLPNNPRPTKQQGETNACTGFALSTVIEYLLAETEDRAVEGMSGYMLYSMARRYDEWALDGEGVDTGSSLRGALKGWSKHGASAERLWDTMEMPAATNDDSDWWLDAVKRPMGAYYRIEPANIRDMHVALHEVRAIYASAFTHTGWDTMLGTRNTPAPAGPDDVPIIPAGQGSRDLGHAFAIVGYTNDGFIVQNSWSAKWGRGGFAVLRYEDWLANAMDCWVVQLGVVTAEHDEVARAPSLRTDRAGRAVISRHTTLADHEISPFVVNMENEGKLSDRGRFRTDEGDLRLLVEHHMRYAANKWAIPADGHLDVAIYAHGGLTTEDAAAATARAWIPHLYSHRIFPIFLMWETGAFDTLGNIFEDAVAGEAEKTGGERWSRFRREIKDWLNERMEGLARRPGQKMWGEMKENADALSRPRPKAKAKGAEQKASGVVQLFEQFQAAAGLPKLRLHLIGHSAGAIVHSYLGPRAIKQHLEVASISMLAPAVRLDLFHEQLGGLITAKNIPVLISNLTDAAERADSTCKPYGHSLLYLVSRSFEDHEETPLLGMEKHLVPALPAHPWGVNVRQLRTPGFSWMQGAAATRATTHGALDNDDAVREAVARFIKG